MCFKSELGVHFFTPLLTVDESGISVPEKLLLVMDNDLFGEKFQTGWLQFWSLLS